MLLSKSTVTSKCVWLSQLYRQRSLSNAGCHLLIMVNSNWPRAWRRCWLITTDNAIGYAPWHLLCHRLHHKISARQGCLNMQAISCTWHGRERRVLHFLAEINLPYCRSSAFARGLTKDNAALPSICGEQPLLAPAGQAWLRSTVRARVELQGSCFEAGHEWLFRVWLIKPGWEEKSWHSICMACWRSWTAGIMVGGKMEGWPVPGSCPACEDWDLYF